MITTAKRRLAALAMVAGAWAGLATFMHAQTSDARWQPWIGCWITGDTNSVGNVGAPGGVVCVRPAPNGSGVDVETMSNGQVVERERIEANGQRVQKTRDNCPGWESAQFTADGKRVLLNSEFTCGSLTRKGSTIMSFSSEGTWIQVVGVQVGNNGGVHVLRYHNSDVTARRTPAARVTLANVQEVAQKVDAAVTEAWLIEASPEFALSGKEIIQLDNAKVPARVIDLMVAMSNPGRFVINRAARPEITALGKVADGSPSIPTYMQWSPFYSDGFGYGYYGNMNVSRSPYDLGLYADRYFRNGYQYGYDGRFYWGQRPILIQPVSVAATSHGRAVNGVGYTRGQGVSTPITAAGPSTSRGPMSGEVSSPGASGSGGGGGGTSTGRTAHARPPR